MENRNSVRTGLRTGSFQTVRINLDAAHPLAFLPRPSRPPWPGVRSLGYLVSGCPTAVILRLEDILLLGVGLL